MAHDLKFHSQLNFINWYFQKVNSSEPLNSPKRPSSIKTSPIRRPEGDSIRSSISQRGDSIRSEKAKVRSRPKTTMGVTGIENKRDSRNFQAS